MIFSCSPFVVATKVSISDMWVSNDVTGHVSGPGGWGILRSPDEMEGLGIRVKPTRHPLVN